MEYVTSDLHFWHKRILELQKETRPFNTVEEMNEHIIQSWNSLVSENDTIYHLGDFSFAGKSKTVSILDRLKGNKVFIIGNHDKRTKNILEDYGLTFYYKKIRRGGTHIILFHFPITFWDMCDHGSVHLFGHMHGTYKNPPGRCVDVGWDSFGRILTMNEAVTYCLEKEINHRR